MIEKEARPWIQTGELPRPIYLSFNGGCNAGPPGGCAG
jgi:hypothetical protein